MGWISQSLAKNKVKGNQGFCNYFKLLRTKGCWNRFNQRKLFYEGSKDGLSMREFFLKFEYLNCSSKLRVQSIPR